MTERKLQRMLRHKPVLEASGKGKTALADAIARGEFPKPVKIGPRAIAWFEDEIIEWQQQRAAERDDRNT